MARNLETYPTLRIDSEVLPKGDDFAALLALADEERAVDRLPFPFSKFILKCDTPKVSFLLLIEEIAEHSEVPGGAYNMEILWGSDDAESVGMIPATFCISKRELRWGWFNIEDSRSNSPLPDGQESNAVSCMMIFLTVLMLLRMSYAKTEIIDSTEINKRRKRMNRPPLPESHVVVVDTEKLARTIHNYGGTHASPTGHDRRGHVRRLRSGKIVCVKPSKINGGSSQPPKYALH